MKRTVERFDRGDHWLVIDTTSGERVVRIEQKAAAKPPGLVQRAKNFRHAAMHHRNAGRPLATDEQVAERFDICASNCCGLFSEAGDGHGQCLHGSCGCSLRAVGSESYILPNKLRWADQACPIGLWAPVVAADSAG